MLWLHLTSDFKGILMVSDGNQLSILSVISLSITCFVVCVCWNSFTVYIMYSH